MKYSGKYCQWVVYLLAILVAALQSARANRTLNITYASNE